MSEGKTYFCEKNLNLRYENHADNNPVHVLIFKPVSALIKNSISTDEHLKSGGVMKALDKSRKNIFVLTPDLLCCIHQPLCTKKTNQTQGHE